MARDDDWGVALNGTKVQKTYWHSGCSNILTSLVEYFDIPEREDMRITRKELLEFVSEYKEDFSQAEFDKYDFLLLQRFVSQTPDHELSVYAWW